MSGQASEQLLLSGWLTAVQSMSAELVAEVSVGLATDTTFYLSRWGEALKVNTLTFTIRASDSSWQPGLPERPLFPAKWLADGRPEHVSKAPGE